CFKIFGHQCGSLIPIFSCVKIFGHQCGSLIPIKPLFLALRAPMLLYGYRCDGHDSSSIVTARAIFPCDGNDSSSIVTARTLFTLCRAR
ncbi:MAG: hypothetical protein AB2401_02595, partial [Bacillus sp. (in: firmicutes)]